MPAVTFNVLASKIAGSGATSCDGANQEGLSEAGQLINGAFYVAGVLYAVVMTGANVLQVYKSTDLGVSWATYGATATPTEHGGGMAVYQDGATLWVGYTAVLASFSEMLYLRSFDTVGGTWGTEHSTNVLTLAGGASEIERPEGPYFGCVRAGGTHVLLLNGTVGDPDVWAVIFDPGSVTFTAAIQFNSGGAGHGSFFSSAHLRPDGTLDVFYVRNGTPKRGQHQLLNPDNSLGTRTQLPTGLLDWNDDGVQWGFHSDQVYLAVGKDTSESGIFGRIAIVYGSDAGWSTTLVLDTSSDVSDYSVYSALLLPSNGYLLCVCRLINSAGTNSIIRVGFVPSGSFNNPSAWNWQTIYDLGSPSPHFSGESGSYTPIMAKGLNSGLTLASDGVFRYVTTLSGVDQFVGLLFTATVLTKGNSFRCARSYY